jgi:hypothetical protein
MRINVVALIIIFVVAVIVAFFSISWFPRDKTVILVILATIVVITPFLFATCWGSSDKVLLVPEAKVPLNPQKGEHSQPGFHRDEGKIPSFWR